MRTKIGLAVVATFMASDVVLAQGPGFSETEMAEALGCLRVYPSVEEQDDCFERHSLLRNGRTAEQVRAFTSDIEGSRKREEERRAAAYEQAQKQMQEAQAREREKCLASVPASEVALVRAQQIVLGMSEAALLCSWGRPERVSRSVGSWGEHKQYIYARANVYVENGKITSWQD